MNDNNTNGDGYSSMYYSSDNISTIAQSPDYQITAIESFQLVLQFLSYMLQIKNTTEEQYSQINKDFIRYESSLFVHNYN